MKANETTSCKTCVSKSLAAEDLRCGDFVGILSEVHEYPSFFWCSDLHLHPPGEPVRMVCRASDGGTPLKVKAISLPFVFVKKPGGEPQMLDVRQHRLVRLAPEYAKAVWKAMGKQRTV